MLNLYYSQEITDAIHGSIIYSGIEREVIGTPFFNRLHRIMQSSMVYMTFPSNQVKRFEHSIGTMHLAGQFFFHSICNSSDEMLDRFFAEVSHELVLWNKMPDNPATHYIHDSILSKFANEDILHAPVPSNRLYAEYLPSNLKPDYKFQYYVVYQAIRLVGMLHDVGHLPYSHVLEYALQLLYREVEKISEDDRKPPHKQFLEIMAKYCKDENAAIHEELGKCLVKKIFDSITDNMRKGESEESYFLAAVIYFTQKILGTNEEGRSPEKSSIFLDLHRIVAGTVDCDRMDYCCRDQYFAGTSREIPNYRRILSGMKIVYRKPEQLLAYKGEEQPEERARCFFAPSAKSIYHIERLLEQRWDIYAAINYHHRVHKHELLLERIIADLGMREMNQYAADGKMPDSIDNVLPLKICSIWLLVEQMNKAKPVEYIALQMDDAWLDTLLKHKYFDQYGKSYLSFRENGIDAHWHRLDELISSKKHYCSLIKRADDFRRFDELLWNGLSMEQWTKALPPSTGEPPKTYTSFLSERGSFVFNTALFNLVPRNEPRRQFFEELEARLNEYVKLHPELKILDCLLSDCTFKPGLSLSEQLYITMKGVSGEELGEKSFHHFSRLYDTLMSKRGFLPSFHVYYLPRYDEEHQEYEQPNLEAFQKALVELSAQLIQESVTGKRTSEGKPNANVEMADTSKGATAMCLQSTSGQQTLRGTPTERKTLKETLKGFFGTSRKK